VLARATPPDQPRRPQCPTNRNRNGMGPVPLRLTRSSDSQSRLRWSSVSRQESAGDRTLCGPGSWGLIPVSREPGPCRGDGIARATLIRPRRERARRAPHQPALKRAPQHEHRLHRGNEGQAVPEHPNRVGFVGDMTRRGQPLTWDATLLETRRAPAPAEPSRGCRHGNLEPPHQL
jgi:hypothetical protein